MNSRKTSLAMLALSFLFSACAGMGSTTGGPVRISEDMLIGRSGMTLYTFDKDVTGNGKSVCNGPCATNWPPLLVTDGESAGSDYSVILRDDGRKQWAFKGKPLYYWVKDQKPGDKTGDGFNSVWHVAKP